MGAFALGAWGFAYLLRLQAQAKATEHAPEEESAVILLWLPGGPPHMEMYDIKPDAPEEWRGEFKPIKTNISGMEVCEHLPLHAKCADKYVIIRSIAHTFADHGGGHKRFLTGREFVHSDQVQETLVTHRTLAR